MRQSRRAGSGSGRAGVRRPAAGELLRELLEALPTGLSIYEVVRDRDGRPVDLRLFDLSRTSVARFGGSRGDLLGRTLRELVPHLPETFHADLLRVATEGGAADTVQPFLNRNKCFRLEGFSPRPGLVAVLATDLTSEKAAEAMLEQSERELRESQRVAHVGSWVRDLRTGVARWSEETFRIHGLDPGGPVPQLGEVADFYTPESTERILTAYGRAARDGTSYDVELDLVRPDGSRGRMVARGEGVRDESGSIVKVRGTVLDISEQARIEEERDELRRALAHVARVSTLGELVSSLAHELSQPIAAILANSQAAQRLTGGESDAVPGCAEALADIVADAKRAGTVIHRLRALLRHEPPAAVPLDVDALALEVEPLVAAEARLRAVSLHLDLAGGLPRVLGDGVQLQQVLLNLILNGMEAAGSGPEPRRVTVRTTRDGGGVVRIEVSDTGPGIPEELLERVFEPFYTTREGGLGIGLPTSRSIVKAHGGTIRAERRPGAGATLVVTLPAAEPTSQEESHEPQ